MAQNERPHQLIKRIEDAFSNTEYPKGITNEGANQYNPETQYLVKYLRGQIWGSLPLENVLATRDSLPWLSSDALHYFLPAYLIAILEYPDQVDVLVDNVVSMLTDMKQEDRQRILKLRDTASNDQRMAVSDFLEYLKTQFIELEEELSLGLEFWRRRAE